MAEIIKMEIWTPEQYKAYHDKQRAKNGETSTSKPVISAKNKTGNGDKAKAEMEMILKLTGLEYVVEHKFNPKRKFRFDYAIPKMLIAIEYEGIVSKFCREGKSGHTTITGYTNNCDKYNEAAKLGWRMLRYTALNYKNLTDDLREIIELSQTKGQILVVGENLSIDTLQEIIKNPKNEFDMHLKNLWDNAGVRGIMRATGLDVSRFFQGVEDTSEIRTPKTDSGNGWDEYVDSANRRSVVNG